MPVTDEHLQIAFGELLNRLKEGRLIAYYRRPRNAVAVSVDHWDEKTVYDLLADAETLFFRPPQASRRSIE
jgi:hypothetical protein